MAAEEAVFTAATARTEVRKSILRMEYHIARGPKGARGVAREVAYLDAMGRQSARLGAKTAAGVNVSAKKGLGQRARDALSAKASGNGASAGRLRSSLLAEYSQDTMSGAREWTNDVSAVWVWVANASACPACLDQHGKTFNGPFTPMHPSCLCYPEAPDVAAANGVDPLTQAQLVKTLVTSNNPAFAATGKALADGAITVEEAAAAATRRSAKGLKRWQLALRDQAGRAAALNPEATPIGAAGLTPHPGTPGALKAEREAILNPPTLAEVKAAKEVVLKEITWLENMQAKSSTRIGFSAKRHEQTLKRAQRIIDRAVTSPVFRAKMDEAVDGLKYLKTLSDTNKGKQTRWAGRFSHRTPYRRDASGKLVPGGRAEGIRGIELQMRMQVQDNVDEWNAAVKAYNAKAKELSDEIRAARYQVQQDAIAQGRRLARYEIDAAIDQDIWARQAALQKTKPTKSKVGLTADRPTQDVAEVLLHEVTHAVDEATEFAYSEKALADGVRDEFRRLAATDDPLASAYRYGAELEFGGKKGHETFAEVVRMYHHGTGIMTRSGTAKQGAAAWREANPVLAKWVEDNVL